MFPTTASDSAGLQSSAHLFILDTITLEADAPAHAHRTCHGCELVRHSRQLHGSVAAAAAAAAAVAVGVLAALTLTLAPLSLVP
jgi:hypothetical protein